MNDNLTGTFQAFADAIAEKTGIDNDAAEKVVTWLITEGVLDTLTVNEEFSEDV